MKLHTFGQVIPYNTDNLPEQGFAVGPGTERPVGFIDLGLLARLYWTVKSFKVSASAVPLLNFTFEAFLLGGGVTGTVLGSLFGLQTALLTEPVPLALIGQTELMHIYQKKVRLARDGVYKNQTQEQFFKKTEEEKNDESNSSSSSLNPNQKPKSALDIDSEIDPNYLISKSYKPTESTSILPGNYHSLINNFGGILINFSDIVYAKRQYWPKIFLFLRNPFGGTTFKSALLIRDPLFSASLNTIEDRTAFRDLTLSTISTPTIGGVSFLGGFIPLYGVGNINIFSIFGSVSIGTRVCDRFYFDGFSDSEREKYDEKICDSVYRKDPLKI